VFVKYAPKTSPLYAVQSEARTAQRGLWEEMKSVPSWEWQDRRQSALRQREKDNGIETHDPLS
jgi:endonuclease YncB( thermonuclease family)